MWKSVKLGLLGFAIGIAWIAAGVALVGAWPPSGRPQPAAADRPDAPP